MPEFIDLTGIRFNRLSVLALADERRYGKPAWWVRCECGREKIIPGSHLRMGQTQSCKCLQRERVRDSNRRRTGRAA
jgi:hypothetical protein